MDSPNFPRDTRVNVTFVARFLFPAAAQVFQAREGCLRKRNVCSFSNITSHQNRLLVFVNHLVLRILTGSAEEENNTDTTRKLTYALPVWVAF
jgi:hypothetical protein